MNFWPIFTYISIVHILACKPGVFLDKQVCGMKGLQES